MDAEPITREDFLELADEEGLDEEWTGDEGNEPVDGSYPPDGEDLLEAIEEGRTLNPARISGRYANNRLLAKERQRRAVELRKAGATFDAIAATLGYSSASGAYNAVKRAIDGTLQEVTREFRVLHYERLNHMLMTKWTGVQKGDDSSISTALAIMDRMVRLFGADAPSQASINLSGDVNIEGAIIVADVDRDSYLKAMQSMVIDAQVIEPGGQAPARGTIGLPPGAEDVTINQVLTRRDEDGAGSVDAGVDRDHVARDSHTAVPGSDVLEVGGQSAGRRSAVDAPGRATKKGTGTRAAIST